MPDYKKMYFQLAAKVANAVDILVEAQKQGEYDYTEEVTLVKPIPYDVNKLQDRIGNNHERFDNRANAARHRG